MSIRPIARSKAPVSTSSSKPASPWVALIGSLLFFAVTIGLVVVGRLPWMVPLAYLIMSAVTIFAYAFDKSAAMNRKWRTKEDTLHLFSLLCGWPGAWIAQFLFRHKTRKTSFMVTFVFCVLVNLGVLSWIVIDPHSPIAHALHSL